MELLSAVIEETDSAVLNAKKERKLDGITVMQRNVPRTVVTSLGELNYKRTYFKLADGSMAYLTDQLIGIEPFERITKELCAELVQNTAAMSMQKAAMVTGAPVSRQTVNNKVLSMHDVVTEVSRVKNTPSELHIFADEDHVHLRPKKSVIVPLVTVTEGIDVSNPKRHKTISPVHFQGYGMDNHTFVDNVVAAIYEKYDMEKVERVYIHADGGRVTAEHIRISRDESDGYKDFNDLKNGLEIYNKYAEKQVKCVFGGKHDWSIFEGDDTPAAFSYGKLTGTTILLRTCAKLRAV